MRTIMQTIIVKKLFTGTRLSFCTLPLESGAYIDGGLPFFNDTPLPARNEAASMRLYY
jgi:hypothetical protein